MTRKVPIARRTILQGVGIGVLAGSAGLASRLFAQGAPVGNAGWATGGTAAMRGAASYPDPFRDAGQLCQLTCEQILGPCYAPRAPVRQDISEGQQGVPMRIAFRLVGMDGCTPLPGAEVEIWHTSPGGVYSAPDVQGGTFCTDGNAEAQASYFFRGRGIADGDGRVTFDSCYPGWYGGRALHVHLLVRMPDHAGEATTANLQTVTQLYFPQDLTREICGEVEGYRDRGQPDVDNASDNVLRRAGEDGFLFAVERMDDGAMQVSKTIAIGMADSCGSRGFRRGG